MDNPVSKAPSRSCSDARKRTIDGLALGEVVVLLARQECVSVSTDDTLNVAGCDVEKETFRHVEDEI